jgi:hypothetical protein
MVKIMEIKAIPITSFSPNNAGKTQLVVPLLVLIMEVSKLQLLQL